MSLDSSRFVGGAPSVGRILTGIRHSWCRAILGTLEGDGESQSYLGACRRSCHEVDGCLK